MEFLRFCSKIIYIKEKSGHEGEQRIDIVFFSKNSKTIYYKAQRSQSLKCIGFKANQIQFVNGGHSWNFGPLRYRSGRLYSGNKNVEID